MAGNVFEWCQDWFDNRRIYRVLRGGYWGSNSYSLRVSFRSYNSPDAGDSYSGFRCVSGSNFTSVPSEGGDFTDGEAASSGEETPLPPANNQGVIEWEKDDSQMVRIPDGPLTSAFYMDKYEVTNAQYRKFVQATGHREPKYWDNSKYNQPNQPVVGVSWHDATAYAKWAGKRLPSEAEWEYAARGGLKGKEYPWGDQEPSSSRANYGSNVGKPTAVGSYPANGYGLYDMAGNA
ncbi:MAG: SUMF1/EgtB/PvdO family nonheme iron enzyme, partial [Candidatus Poribacteria bacterium]|nr:SUMF1/EgtB/PvdO family nonheme iron enzyme [Candidatus Poribacteria bacterium]